MTPEYLAGFFDGEGCIDTQILYPSEKNARKRFYCRPRVRISQTKSGAFVIYEIQQRFGGHVAGRKGVMGNDKDSVSLEILGARAMKDFLNEMLPHLVLKREQAKLALWWIDNMSGRQSRNGYPAMENARKTFSEELKKMKLDPQRLNEVATLNIEASMRQSDLHGDMQRLGEIASPPT